MDAMDMINSRELVSIMGLDPVSGPLVVYASKTHSTPLPVDRRREALVKYVVSLYEERTSRRVVSVQPYRREWRESKPDGVVVLASQQNKGPHLQPAMLTHNSGKSWADTLLVVATPTSETFYSWGSESNFLIHPRRPPIVPIRSVVECVWHMHVTGIHRCDLVALIDDEIRIYGIEYDLFFADAIESAAKCFLELHIEKRVPPQPDFRPLNREVLIELFPEPKTGLMIEPTQETVAMAQRLSGNKSLMRMHGLQAEELINKLCLAVGDAEGIEDVCTWKKEERGKINWEGAARHLWTLYTEEGVDMAIAEAEEATGSKGIDALAERFRGEGIRRFRLLGEPNEQ